MKIFGKRAKRINFKYLEQSLRYPVAVIFLLILLILLAEDVFRQGFIKIFTVYDWALLGGGFLGLFLVEWLESRFYPRQLILPTRLLLIGVRIILVAGIYQADVTMSTLPVFAVVLYAMYFYFGAIPTILALALSMGIIVPSARGLGISVLEEAAYIIFMLIFAGLIRQDDKIRLRNLDLYRELENYASNSSSLAKLDERNRISRDLHDNLGHYLVAVNIQLQKAVAYREINMDESNAAVQQAQQATAEAMKELRQTLNNLREMDTVRGSFHEELERLVKGVEANGLSVALTIQGEEEGYSELVLVTLRQAVQEGLTNIQKHAQANQAELTINFGKKRIQFMLKDDGVGFSPKKVDETRSFGLRGLRERIALLGGEIAVKSRKNKGTTLQIVIPKQLYA